MSGTTMEDIPQDVWTDVIAPRLLVRDVVALSLVSKWGHRVAHTLSKTRDSYLVEDPTLTLEKIGALGKHWKSLEGIRAQVMDAGCKTRTGVIVSLDQFEINLKTAGILPFVEVVGLSRVKNFGWVTNAIKTLHLKNYGWYPLNPQNLDPVTALVEAIPNWTHLSALDIENGLSFEDKIPGLLQALGRLTQLVDVRLAKIGLKDEGASRIAELVRAGTPAYVRLALPGNEITVAGVKHLREALTGNTTVKSFDLSENAFGGEGAKEISELLKAETAIDTLNISGTNLGVDGISHIKDALNTNTTLRTLICRNNSIEGGGVDHLSHILNNNTTLTSLDVGGNFAQGDNPTRQLLVALSTNASLKHLSLEDCYLKGDISTSLGSMLNTNATLTSLNISRNEGLEVTHLQAIFEPLRTANTTLKNLDLNYIRHGNDLAKPIAEMLQTNKGLVRLNLNMSLIDAEAAHAIADALQVNTTLVFLGIKIDKDNTQKTPQVLAAFKDAYPADTYFAEKVNSKRPTWVDL